MSRILDAPDAISVRIHKLFNERDPEFVLYADDVQGTTGTRSPGP